MIGVARSFVWALSSAALVLATSSGAFADERGNGGFSQVASSFDVPTSRTGLLVASLSLHDVRLAGGSASDGALAETEDAAFSRKVRRLRLAGITILATGLYLAVAMLAYGLAADPTSDAETSRKIVTIGSLAGAAGGISLAGGSLLLRARLLRRREARSARGALDAPSHLGAGFVAGVETRWTGGAW